MPNVEGKKLEFEHRFAIPEGEVAKLLELNIIAAILYNAAIKDPVERLNKQVEYYISKTQLTEQLERDPELVDSIIRTIIEQAYAKWSPLAEIQRKFDACNVEIEVDFIIRLHLGEYCVRCFSTPIH